MNIDKIRWEVQKNNKNNSGAIKFYKRLGAEINTKGIFKWNAT
jgi:ribosomal protein S18 acetylase RimI-like enzyme